jgi:hypothetical protein
MPFERDGTAERIQHPLLALNVFSENPRALRLSPRNCLEARGGCQGWPGGLTQNGLTRNLAGGARSPKPEKEKAGIYSNPAFAILLEHNEGPSRSLTCTPTFSSSRSLALVNNREFADLITSMTNHISERDFSS